MFVFCMFFFFFNDTATPEIYTLSLHDALPIPFLSEYPVSVLQAHDGRAWNHQTGAGAVGAEYSYCEHSRTKGAVGIAQNHSDLRGTRVGIENPRDILHDTAKDLIRIRVQPDFGRIADSHDAE